VWFRAVCSSRAKPHDALSAGFLTPRTEPSNEQLDISLSVHARQKGRVYTACDIYILDGKVNPVV
jgi:hypothetical protein